MTETARRPSIILIVLFGVGFLLIFGLLLVVDYSLVLALLAGLVIAAIIVALLRATKPLRVRFVEWIREDRKRLALIIGLPVITIIIAALLILSISLFAGDDALIGAGGKDKGSRCELLVTVSSDDWRSGTFKADIESTDDDNLTMPLKAVSRGLLLREVTFVPGDDLGPECARSNRIDVELHEFPQNVYFQARYARDLQQKVYLDTETTLWNQREDEISFTYISPGLRFTRPLLPLF